MREQGRHTHPSRVPGADVGPPVRILGVPFRPLTVGAFLAWMEAAVERRAGAYGCAVNASSVVMAGRDRSFMRALTEADVNLPDGAPVAWAISRLIRARQPRLPGPAMMLEALGRAEQRGFRVLLYGSSEDVLRRLSSRLREAYPRLELVDAIAPPFRALTPAEDDEICERIREARPDIVFVGLGAPKQELWMHAHRDRLGALLMGVGAAFDFHAGVVRRAPPLVQRAGLEWMHRMVQEPGRLWKRYATTLPVFAWNVVWELVRTQPATPRDTARPGTAERGELGGVRTVLFDTSNPDQMTGGQSVFIRNLLSRLGGEVAVVGATSGAERLGVWQQRSLHGTTYRFMAVARMAAPGRPPRIPLRFSALLGVARFRRAILAAGDVMYVQSPEMGLPLTIGNGRKPIVLHLHGADNPLIASRYSWARNPLPRHLYGRLHRHMINASLLVLCVDQAGLRLCSRALRRGSATKVLLVPVCVDTSLFCPGDRTAARLRRGIAEADEVVVFVGRLEEAKGTEELVEALGLLSARDPEVRLIVVGDGSQREGMGERARALGVSDRLEFAGWVEHQQLPALLQACDVLVLPSAHEGLPTAVLEALACGVPVVATPVGDVSRVVREGVNGALLDDRTPTALADALEGALATHWSVGEVAASVEEYSVDKIVPLISGLLRDAAGLGGRRPGQAPDRR